MDFVFGILDLVVTYLVQGLCNQVDFELPCCKCLLQHLISECFGVGTAVIGGSLHKNFEIAITWIANIIQHHYFILCVIWRCQIRDTCSFIKSHQYKISSTTSFEREK